MASKGKIDSQFSELNFASLEQVKMPNIAVMMLLLHIQYLFWSFYAWLQLKSWRAPTNTETMEMGITQHLFLFDRRELDGQQGQDWFAVFRAKFRTTGIS